MQRGLRMERELKMLADDPPHGVSCWTVDDKLDHLEARHHIEWKNYKIIENEPRWHQRKWAEACHLARNKNTIFNRDSEIVGAEGTPYQGGIFKIDIQIPERYPFEPPKMKFVTPIYHPNIDSSGRICLDIIKMPPKGMWRPALNIAAILSSILLLLGKPNPDDPLMVDIANEFRYDYSKFVEKAKQWTLTHAADHGALTNKNQTEKKKLPSSVKSTTKEMNPNEAENAIDSDSSSRSDTDEENSISRTNLQGVKRIQYDEPSTSGLRPNKMQKK